MTVSHITRVGMLAKTVAYLCLTRMDKGSGITENTTVSITKSETWEKHKKFTVYKVAVNSGGKSWFIFRRYNEFNKLFDVLKKQMPGFHMKLPGKKLFGNNFDPEFIKARREGLDNFIQKIMSDSALYNHPEVKTFLLLDNPKNCHEEEIEETSEDGVQIDDKLVDLGPTEKPHAKSSDFEFLKVIGKGSFGKVLLAKHKVELKIYAIKVLQKKMIIKRNETKHIMSERNVLLKNLHHPFLVGLHYSFQTSDKLYFVLDYVNGGELFFHLQRERYFPEHRSRFYAAEMASALGYLHSHGIVYRDLKPENILLDSIGHIVLTDFGLCKEGIVGHNDTTTTFCGTPEYLAPEVIRKQAYDRSVDWWCLGAVLFEMLYGLLLQKDKSVRLGSGENDFLDIKLHPFFKSMDWNAVDAKEIEPPFNPNVNGSLDLKNIDPEFTKEPVPAYIRMLDQIFRLGTSNIKLHNNTNKIGLEKGVRQGDSISPKIFTACLENVFRYLNWTSKGILINGDSLTNLRFADDVVLFSESPQELQLMVEELRTASNKVGLEINLSKTKVMFNRNVEIQPIMTGNVALDQVDRFTYLGQLISIHRDWEPEVRRRVALASLGKSHVPFSASVQDTDNAFVGFSYAPPLEDIM
ncbi:Serine/threonine-protein kinase Sgk3 [Nymphon striatum]|nr:Serine/threonine-protein kinase Sgk3 [Nymphon striatum]